MELPITHLYTRSHVVKTDFIAMKWVCPSQESNNEIWDWDSMRC